MKDLFPIFEKAHPKQKPLMNDLYHAATSTRRIPDELMFWSEADYSALVMLATHHRRAYRKMIRSRWTAIQSAEESEVAKLCSAADYLRLAKAVSATKGEFDRTVELIGDSLLVVNQVDTPTSPDPHSLTVRNIDVAVVAVTRQGIGQYWREVFRLPVDHPVLISDLFREAEGSAAIVRDSRMMKMFFLDPSDAVAFRLRHSEIILEVV